jgi:hypothetical protein
MTKYRIGRSYNQVNSEEEIVVEAASQEQAEEMAWEWAMEAVSSWASPLEEEDVDYE